jgi:hypothetical protein
MFNQFYIIQFNSIYVRVICLSILRVCHSGFNPGGSYSGGADLQVVGRPSECVHMYDGWIRPMVLGKEIWPTKRGKYWGLEWMGHWSQFESQFVWFAGASSDYFREETKCFNPAQKPWVRRWQKNLKHGDMNDFTLRSRCSPSCWKSIKTTLKKHWALG